MARGSGFKYHHVGPRNYLRIWPHVFNAAWFGVHKLFHCNRREYNTFTCIRCRVALGIGGPGFRNNDAKNAEREKTAIRIQYNILYNLYGCMYYIQALVAAVRSFERGISGMRIAILYNVRCCTSYLGVSNDSEASSYTLP